MEPNGLTNFFAGVGENATAFGMVALIAQKKQLNNHTVTVARFVLRTHSIGVAQDLAEDVFDEASVDATCLKRVHSDIT